MKKPIALAVMIIAITASIAFAMGKITALTFWIMIAAAAFFAYKILPRMN
ncbi:MAG TPA: hypothetical protein VJH97_03315 [Candidatus Nanoarchaeia archaeon]|nr:hypothetical protein [Candidatus Nanoarchaeia archaeon]